MNIFCTAECTLSAVTFSLYFFCYTKFLHRDSFCYLHIRHTLGVNNQSHHKITKSQTKKVRMSRHKLKSKEHDKKNRVKIGQTVTERMAAQTRQVGKKTLLRKRPEKFLLVSTYLKCTRIIVLGVPCDAGPLWHLMLAFVHF